MTQQSLLRKAHYIPVGLAVVYLSLLGLLTIPSFQRELVFLHHVRFPLRANFDNPEKYGLAPFKTRNLRLNTPDGEEIGAWHVMPHSIYHAQSPFPPRQPLDEEIFDQALRERPTIIYFHGNAASRAAPSRVRSYSAFSTQLDCNVLAIDYRGYADSTGTPREQGLLTDAKTAWDWVVERTRSASDADEVIKGKGHNGHGEEEGRKIILVGQSLGTGVVAGLAGHLAQVQHALDDKQTFTPATAPQPAALVLIAPFTSITDLLTSYKLFRSVPLLSPLAHVPGAQRFFQSFLYDTFDSASALSNTWHPTLLLHAKNDLTIPHSHSANLFQTLRRASASAPPATHVSGETPVHIRSTEITYKGWGTVRSFPRQVIVEKEQKQDVEGKGSGEVVWWEGESGGHNNLAWAEGTLDLIKRIAKL